MEHLFEKYKNIQSFATEYRKYKLLDKNFVNYEEFKNKMQTSGFIFHRFEDTNDKIQIDLYFFKEDSKYIVTTSFFKKLLDKYDKNKHYVIFITKEPLNIYRRKTVKNYDNLIVNNYLHRNFLMKPEEGPLCSKHTVLTTQEARKVCFSLMAHGHNLATIYDKDPQCIWINAKPNDIVKIESISEITGKSIRYRLVIPSPSKLSYEPEETEEQKEEIVKKEVKKAESDEDEYEEDFED